MIINFSIFFLLSSCSIYSVQKHFVNIIIYSTLWWTTPRKFPLLKYELLSVLCQIWDIIQSIVSKFANHLSKYQSSFAFHLPTLLQEIFHSWNYEISTLASVNSLRFEVSYQSNGILICKILQKKLSRNNNQVLLFNKQHDYKYNLSFIFLNCYVYSNWYFMKERWKWRSAFSITDNAYCVHTVTVLKLTECIQKQTCDKIVLN